MKTTRISATSLAFPEGTLSNEELADIFEGWDASKIEKKLGIKSRHVLAEDEMSSDIAVKAAENLFAEQEVDREQIDYLIFCTQAPDYLLPTTACIIHDRIGLPKNCGAVDINQGCSGYIHGLVLAKGLIESGSAKQVLLLTADAYSKYVGKDDASVRTLFGDGASATLLSASDFQVPDSPPASSLNHFVFGTDGSGAGNLILANSALKQDGSGNGRAPLYMNGPEVLNFTLREIPPLQETILQQAQLTMDDLDFVILHQANSFLLAQLARKLKIPPNKFLVDMADVGNTVSSTIPVVLHRAIAKGKIRRGDVGLLAGFGVGLSWGGCILRY